MIIEKVLVNGILDYVEEVNGGATKLYPLWYFELKRSDEEHENKIKEKNMILRKRIYDILDNNDTFDRLNSND